MAVTALLMSILAVVLSAVSIAWQAWSWRRSGPVLRVTTAASVAAVSDDHVEHFVSVSVANTGRAAATVEGWGFRLPNGMDYVVLRPPPFSAQVPMRVEPHASATFLVGADELRHHIIKAGVAFKDVRPFVRTAADKRVFSEAPVPLG